MVRVRIQVWNLPSLHTARRLGRQPIQQEYLAELPARGSHLDTQRNS